eukprot:CAMPEP_0118896848 /NCGR_PEP_ID=MMETSP1166-20130328/4514_1 /TAXON_ID=1104430 /ORGANISM="Chrysoreinhardia sp, Strain CCMP3193" /LENGTH=226 /DNA_ID=CAMNT_0006835907 /DNA_START=27 /DNA_END=709 /DNA_ORIENTATION=+
MNLPIALFLLASCAEAFAPPAATAATRRHQAAAPLKAVIPGDSLAESIVVNGSINFFSIYNGVLTARILLSWFPQSMSVPFLQPIFIVTEPFLGLFRGLLPPIGGLDLSLIPALILLQAAGGAMAALGADPSVIAQNSTLSSPHILLSSQSRAMEDRTMLFSGEKTMLSEKMLSEKTTMLSEKTTIVRDDDHVVREDDHVVREDDDVREEDILASSDMLRGLLQET